MFKSSGGTRLVRIIKDAQDLTLIGFFFSSGFINSINKGYKGRILQTEDHKTVPDNQSRRKHEIFPETEPKPGKQTFKQHLTLNT